MKIAIITDTHAGVRGDSPTFLDIQEKFFQKVFFPELEKRNIDTVLHLGDIFDRRKFINFVTLKRTKDMFLTPLEKNNIKMYAVAGNHDVFYKNTNQINALDLLLGEYSNVEYFYEEPVEMTFGSTKIMLSPWITKDNYAASMKAFEDTNAPYLMGHFEFQGFEMMKGQISDHGFDKKTFSKFEAVYSGHFHHPSENGNIKYLGAPYEMVWSDYDGKRGFHIFDTETRELEFIYNPYRAFFKLEYDDVDLTIEEIQDLDMEILDKGFVKLVVKNKQNPQLLDILLDKISNSGCADVKVVEDALNLDSIDEADLVDETKDTKDILHSYIDAVDTNVDKDKIKKLINGLYAEALTL